MLKKEIEKLSVNIWTVPNVLTMIRLLLIPVFVVLYMNGHPKGALAVFTVASLTDLLDGFLARKLNQISNFGKLFDPLADTLMVLTALICQGVGGVIPWAAILIIAGKELVLVCGGLFMLSRDIVVYSNMVGKTAQAMFIVSLILSFFHEEFAAWGVRVDLIILWLTVALALTAMVIYIVTSAKDYLAKKHGKELSTYK